MRVRWTPIEAICRKVTDLGGEDFDCWVETPDGGVAAGVRREGAEAAERSALTSGERNVGTVYAAGGDCDRYLPMLVLALEQELAHQSTVNDMADATARQWKHTNALVRMAARTRLSLPPAEILDSILAIVERSTKIGKGVGVVRLQGDPSHTVFRGQTAAPITSDFLAPLRDLSEDVAVVGLRDDSSLVRVCSEAVGGSAPFVVARLATDSVEIGYVIASVDEGDTVTAEDMKVIASAAQMISIAIENSYTLRKEREATRLQVENELLATQTRDMEEMVHVVAHDLRSPMTALYGFVHVALDEIKDLKNAMGSQADAADADPDVGVMAEAIAEPLRDAIRSVEKLNRMVQRLMEFSRSARGTYSFEKIELGGLVGGVIRSLRYQLTTQNIETELGKLPMVTGDRVQLEAVFGNLIDNAIKYMGEGAERRISIGCQGDTQPVYFVRDTGVGMNSDQVSKSFLPFRRFHGDAAPGDGIGLPHVRKIIERHGGRIWCESEEGVGSTFYFTLATAPKPVARLPKTNGVRRQKRTPQAGERATG